jgi:type IV secretion system protein VirB9
MNRTLLLVALLAIPALAPPLSAKDPRIATRFYDPSQIVIVHGHTGIQSTIEFGPDEHIDNVAVGDSADWQVTPNKHASLLFVKPMQPTARTNMTVVTDQRTYLFDLVATPGATPVYVLRFTYPAEPKLIAVLPPAAVTPEPLAPLADKTPAPTPADLNFAWTSAGAKQLLPSRTFDDGKATWLAWPKDSAMPAILVREPNGEEGPVNYRVQGDYVVVDGVPAQLVLRAGKLMATLTPSPRAAAPQVLPAIPPQPAAQPVGAQTASARP